MNFCDWFCFVDGVFLFKFKMCILWVVCGLCGFVLCNRIGGVCGVFWFLVWGWIRDWIGGDFCWDWGCIRDWIGDNFCWDWGWIGGDFCWVWCWIGNDFCRDWNWIVGDFCRYCGSWVWIFFLEWKVLILFNFGILLWLIVMLLKFRVLGFVGDWDVM